MPDVFYCPDGHLLVVDEDGSYCSVCEVHVSWAAVALLVFDVARELAELL